MRDCGLLGKRFYLSNLRESGDPEMTQHLHCTDHGSYSSVSLLKSKAKSFYKNDGRLKKV